MYYFEEMPLSIDCCSCYWMTIDHHLCDSGIPSYVFWWVFIVILLPHTLDTVLWVSKTPPVVVAKRRCVDEPLSSLSFFFSQMPTRAAAWRRIDDELRIVGSVVTHNPGLIDESSRKCLSIAKRILYSFARRRWTHTYKVCYYLVSNAVILHNINFLHRSYASYS